MLFLVSVQHDTFLTISCSYKKVRTARYLL